MSGHPGFDHNGECLGCDAWPSDCTCLRPEGIKMGSVYLVYVDDYGGTFSPYKLHGVYRDRRAADAVAKSMLGTVTEHADLGDGLAAYPQYRGGKYRDDAE